MAATDFIRKRFFPHIWCPGCGHGTVLNALLRAFDRMNINKNNVVMVSGIGCSSRITGYVDVHTLHTLHGRALSFATGVKMSRPELTVIVPMGDGDALSIGGNHFIHAARRNIDLTAIVMNNQIYGMTGGQFSPLTDLTKTGTTTPFGNIDPAFDIVNLAITAGASFVARTTAFHAPQIADILIEAIAHKGFSVVEILTQCPTYFGRKNKLGEAPEMLEFFKDQTTPIGSKAKKENAALIERGIFLKKELPEYCSEYDRIISNAMKGGA